VKDSEGTPLAVVTVAGVAVFSADTNLTVDEAVKTTAVPVSAIAASATDVPAVIAFAEGTATVFGAADVVAGIDNDCADYNNDRVDYNGAVDFVADYDCDGAVNVVAGIDEGA
jgi:hypothetical protein